MISLEQFCALDLRIGEITSARPIAGTNRLLRLEVSLGAESRVLVAGLAPHYPPQSLIGLQVVVLANIKPAVLQGVESQGMLLGADCGMIPALLTVNHPVDNGTRVE